jgi:predicted nuclease of predicted toxin-antitoxin system
LAQAPSIRLYTDEDVTNRLAETLRRRGFDAISCHEVGNAGVSRPDEWQLNYSVQTGRAILTHNVRDFTRLAHRWAEVEMEHAGIILAPQVSFPELLSRTLLHLNMFSMHDQRNVTLFRL